MSALWHRLRVRVDLRAAVIAGVYLVVAVLWITGSDWLAARLAGGDVALYERLQSIKGLAFVAVLAIGLYAAIAWANAREWRLAAAKHELEETLMVAQRLEALGTLAGTIVHDFNNVIAVIRGTTGLIQMEGLATPPIAARLRQIDQAADQAEQLVRQLRLFMRNAPLTFETADLAAVVREFAPLLERAAGREVTLRTELGDALRPVRLVRSQVESALLNLVLNARDAMAAQTPRRLLISAGSRVLSRYRSPFRAEPASGEFFVLGFADTGNGIPREAQVRIFSPFYTTKAPGHGTGLGLASVLRVMQTHGGWVEVESEPGHGATFTLFFPAAAAPAGPSPRPIPGP